MYLGEQVSEPTYESISQLRLILSKI